MRITMELNESSFINSISTFLVVKYGKINQIE